MPLEHGRCLRSQPTPGSPSSPRFLYLVEEMSDDEDLAPNWRAAKAADGKEYYFNEVTGETSWTKPAPPSFNFFLFSRFALQAALSVRKPCRNERNETHCS